MIAFIFANWATVLISMGLLAVVVMIVAGLIKKKKAGKPVGCCCANCPGCPSASASRKQ